MLIPCIPALTHSAIKVAVYKANANVNAISSGGIPKPPSYINDVVDICFKTGIEKFKETPPIKKVNKGKIINNPSEIKKTGNCRSIMGYWTSTIIQTMGR